MQPVGPAAMLRAGVIELWEALSLVVRRTVGFQPAKAEPTARSNSTDKTRILILASWPGRLFGRESDRRPHL